MSKKRSSGALTLRLVLLGFVVLALAVFAVATWFPGQGADGANAGTVAAETAAVRVYEGRHTVRHSLAALPSAEQPREDGRYTLVWFSAPW